MTISFEELIREINAWQDKTFPHATPKTAAAHLFREAEELYEHPTDWEEMADVFILVAGIAHLSGVDLKAAVQRKLETNKLRKWGEPDEEGVVEHTPEEQTFLKIVGIDILSGAVEEVYFEAECVYKAGVPAHTVDGMTEWVNINIDTRDQEEDVRWEPVKQFGTDRTGKVRRYSKNGREYAGQIIWDDEGEEKGDDTQTEGM